MSKDRDRTVYRRDDSKWANKRNDAGRASSLHDTQREAIDAAKGMLQNQGGGELTTKESLNNPMFAVSRGRGGLDVKLDDIADRPGAALVTGYGANRRYPRRSASFPAVPPAAGRLLPCHPVA